MPNVQLETVVATRKQLYLVEVKLFKKFTKQKHWNAYCAAGGGQYIFTTNVASRAQQILNRIVPIIPKRNK